MQLTGFCLRCGRHFAGPDEGCPECDRGNPDVTSARNRFLSREEIEEAGFGEEPPTEEAPTDES